MRINWKKSIDKNINGFLIKDIKRDGKHTYAFAECPRCHKDKWIRADHIKNNISCGCYNQEVNYLKPIDISGKRYKFLIAIRPTDRRDKDGNVFWECKCTCGKMVYVEASSFIHGEVASCGCKRSEMQSEIAKMMYENGKQQINEYKIANTDVHKIVNDKLISTNTSGYTGVTWDKSRNKWLAQIIFQGKNYHLGRYEDKKLAIEAREKAEEMLHGDFLRWYAETYPDKWAKLNKNKD